MRYQRKIIEKYNNLRILKHISKVFHKKIILIIFLLSIIASTISTVQATITYSDIDLAQSLTGLGYEVN